MIRLFTLCLVIGSLASARIAVEPDLAPPPAISHVDQHDVIRAR